MSIDALSVQRIILVAQLVIGKSLDSKRNYRIIRINNIMKYIYLIIAAFSFSLVPAIAGGYTNHTYTKYHTYGCGCCSHWKQVFIGYDHCGKPRYNKVYVPVRHTCRRPVYTYHNHKSHRYTAPTRYHGRYYRNSHYRYNHGSNLNLRFGNGCNSLSFRF